jgi:hypothetical protein
MCIMDHAVHRKSTCLCWHSKPLVQWNAKSTDYWRTEAARGDRWAVVHSASVAAMHALALAALTHFHQVNLMIGTALHWTLLLQHVQFSYCCCCISCLTSPHFLVSVWLGCKHWQGGSPCLPAVLLPLSLWGIIPNNLVAQMWGEMEMGWDGMRLQQPAASCLSCGLILVPWEGMWVEGFLVTCSYSSSSSHCIK